MSTQLSPEDHEAIARRVVELLRDQDRAGPGCWQTADQVALRLGVSRDYVYRHADELGARRLGEGPRAHLRFDPAAVAAYGRSDDPIEQVSARASRSRRGPTHDVELLPIRGTETRSRPNP
jgi:hypothetical protein